MVSQIATVAEFETADGLRIELALKVTDERGEADIIAGGIIDGLEQLVAQTDAAKALEDLLATGIEVVAVETVPVKDIVGDECECGQCSDPTGYVGDF